MNQTTWEQSGVTLQEALAKLIWAKQSRSAITLYDKLEETAEANGNSGTLSNFYRTLDAESIEVWLAARIDFLSGDEVGFLWKPHPKNPERRELDSRVQKAIDKQEKLLTKIPAFRSELVGEAEKADSQIKTVLSPSIVRRYSPLSIAAWAKETLEIDITEWQDYSQLDLVDLKNRNASWVKNAIDQAHLHILSSLLDAARRVFCSKDYNRSYGMPNLFSGGSEHSNASINPTAFVEYIENILSKVAVSSDGEKHLSHDMPRQILNVWDKQEELLLSNLDPYGVNKKRCVRSLITALAIGVSIDVMPKVIREDKKIDWAFPADSLDHRSDNVEAFTRTRHEKL